MLKKIQFVAAAGAMFFATAASAAYYDDMIAAADGGQCIEDAVAAAIGRDGTDKAGEIVAAGLQAASQRAEQQRALGCAGDIAAKAIAAGADPDDVLGATAAGLPGGGAPANLGGIGGGTIGGGSGSASAS